MIKISITPLILFFSLSTQAFPLFFEISMDPLFTSSQQRSSSVSRDQTYFGSSFGGAIGLDFESYRVLGYFNQLKLDYNFDGNTGEAEEVERGIGAGLGFLEHYSAGLTFGQLKREVSGLSSEYSGFGLGVFVDGRYVFSSGLYLLFQISQTFRTQIDREDESALPENLNVSRRSLKFGLGYQF